MSAPRAVLYDALGPRARARSRLLSVVVVLVLAAVLAVVVVRLAAQGQFAYDRWGPLVDPTNVDFPLVWALLGRGLANTLLAAAVAIVLSLAIGTAMAVGRLMLGRGGRIPLVALIEVLRGLPVILAIYFADRLFREAGVDLDALPGPDGMWVVVVGLTAYNSVVIAEIVRSGVASLPRGQREAALAVGLTPAQAMRSVQLPQAFRTALPALISQLVVVLKDTSLAAVLAIYGELLLSGRRIQLELDNPIQTFFVVGVLFVLLNYGLSRLAVWVEGRAGRRTAAAPAQRVDVQEGAGA